MFIKDIFIKSIDRDIQSVIKVSKNDRDALVEVDEYVVTDEILNYICKFITSYKDTFENKSDEIGFWISGFFGSGKSHFLKILYYILKDINIDILIKNNKSLSKIYDDLKFVSKLPKDVILFNIDSKNRKEGSILDVFVNEFNAMRGFSHCHGFICELEEQLYNENIFDDFKRKFLEYEGNNWEDSRARFYFHKEGLIRALSDVKGFSVLESEKYFESIEKNYKINIDTFTHNVSQYINQMGEDYSLVFMVDEVSQFIADDANKTLNLQTIVEELSTKCLGRVFVIVTSHVDIVNITESKKYDFSKIQGRFENKFQLSSINIGEVLSKRLLLKKDRYVEEISQLYYEKEFFINTKLKFDFSKKIVNKDEFLKYYPFPPYQLNLLRETIFYMIKNNVISNDISKGERSIINCFQKVLIEFKDYDMNKIVPFYMFYDAINDFIDYNHQYIFSILKDYTMLDKFDINVLKVLFLIKYVPNVATDIDTITSLMILDIEQEFNIRNKVNNSLIKLMNEGFINRDGDKFYFLSKNERDINYKIIRSNIDSHEIKNLLCEEIFERLIGINKFKYEGKVNFKLNRFLDDVAYKNSSSNVIGITVLMTNYDENFNLDNIRVLSTIENNVLIYINDDRKLLDEINLYFKLDKFLKYHKKNYKDEFEDIILQKEVELKNRLDRMRVLLLDSIKNADVFVNGEIVSNNFDNINELIKNSLNKLISCKFNKFFYIDKFIDTSKNLIKVIQSNSLYNEFSDSNVLFIKELLSFINGFESIKLINVIEHFRGIPYGFNKNDVLFGVIYLLREKRVICEQNLEELILNKSSLNNIEIKTFKNVNQNIFDNYKRIVEEIFNKKYFVDTLEELKSESYDDFKRLIDRVDFVCNILKHNESYPDRDFIYEFMELIKEFENHYDYDEDEIIMKFEKFEVVYNFYNSVQFEIFKNGIHVKEIFLKDKNFLDDDSELFLRFEKIKEILDNENPYKSISKLKTYINLFLDEHKKVLDFSKNNILNFLNSEILHFIGIGLFKDLEEKLDACVTIFDLYGIKMEGIFLKDKVMSNE